MNVTNANLAELFRLVQSIGQSFGMHFFGAATLDVGADFARYVEWLGEKRHGDMAYLENHLAIRKNPEGLLPGAKTAWVFGFPYFLGDKWRPGAGNDHPAIAQYGRLADYHKFMRKKLENIRDQLIEQHTDCAAKEWRITVDSAPLLERALAANSGGGFIGKNTCLIHPQKGSFFLLGELITSWNPGVEPVEQVASRHQPRTPAGGCGTCRRCQVHCPTGALDKDYTIDARKCLSWMTIENRGLIDETYWPWVGQYMYGCDICQLVCPYNRGAQVTGEAQDLVKMDPKLDLFAIATMDQGFYELTFGGTPMTRAKIHGLKRNALIAMYVRNDERLEKALAHNETHESAMVTGTVRQIRTRIKNSEKAVT